MFRARAKICDRFSEIPNSIHQNQNCGFINYSNQVSGTSLIVGRSICGILCASGLKEISVASAT